MVAATNRVFSIIPGTDHPSTDRQLYLLQDGFNIVKQGLQNKGWVNVTANAVGASKNNSFSYTNYMSQYGERGGPMATYLVTANKSANFHLWLNTSVERINRINGHATSLNVIPTTEVTRAQLTLLLLPDELSWLQVHLEIPNYCSEVVLAQQICLQSSTRVQMVLQ
jgi:hypothetical protein